ncbi:chaoptin-like [Uloborus diversus]|uniref:chaoptin-like n=1 Tax=Uloborus diversus TaxID=327109 RepID=UPI0024099386|nr:chaoptin-like [Uloborus diversus]
MTFHLPAAAVAISLTLIAMTIGTVPVFGHSEPCPFNPLCTCSNSLRDVSCIGVPFAEVPLLPLEDVFQLTLLKAGVEILHDHSFQSTRISSLRMMQNQLSLIHSKAFHGSEMALTTVDLSFNKLHRLPQEALQKLRHLQWLSLHSNDIDDWPSLNTKPNLQSLFLGDNRISHLPDGAFSGLHNLTSLDLDQNCLVQIDRQAFPVSLQTLSLSNNLLQRLPADALHSLRNLTWLQLGGNLFDEMPKHLRLPVKQLRKLDLSHNLLVAIPARFMNDTDVVITNLHLEFNYIETIFSAAFKGLVVERLSLSNNRISSVPDGAFEGLQEKLKALDLSHNLLEIFPKALKDLTSLSHLYLRGNSLKDLDQYDLYGCRYDLEVLDLSGNRLRKIPREALKITQRISRLSLQDNYISSISAGDFSVWGQSLNAINLANNELKTISADAFLGTTKLREIRLSYNSLNSFNSSMFRPLKSTLEILEIGSFSTPDLEALQGMGKVKWLQMDHINLLKLSPSTFADMPSLIHCDLEGNKLKIIPLELFRSNVHTRLNSIVFANNEIESVETDTFNKLPLLTNIVLFGNKIKVLRTQSFRDMSILNTIILARNEIQYIEKAAFMNLKSVTNIFLQDNQLTEFSFEGFHKVGDAKNHVFLNLSNNKISQFSKIYEEKDGKIYIKVRSLDFSCNLLSYMNGNFFRPVGATLHYLFLSSNRITSLDSSTFLHLPNLQVLHLDGNLLSNLPNGVFQNCLMLQIIHIGHNNLTTIFSGAFRNLSSLRILDLSYNNIKTLPEDVFIGTSLERLNLSNNNIFHAPIHSLAHVRSTLRYLDLSHNRISSIPTNGLNHLHNLLSLNLSCNQLKSLSEDAFGKLVYLLYLDLSHNSLWRWAPHDGPLKALVSLQTLLLKNSSLSLVPNFPLPSLRVLDLSYNLLNNISDLSFSSVKELRQLDLSHNYLSEVPSHVWPSTSRLTKLDISYNPIQILPMNTFRKLERLRELDLRGLDLKDMDFRILHNLKFLTTFKTSTYVGLSSFRLQYLLSKSCSLRRVLVEVEETNLSHQLQWSFGSKLRELTITGRNLQYILPDAFQGLRTHELVLRITGTSISRLPSGLLKYLADIRYLTLDIRGNYLTTMDEDVLSPANRIKAEGFTTQHISGGVLLDDNPWVCGCGLVWLGGWIRRWMRETLRVQMLHFDGFLYAQNLARRTYCIHPGTNATIALVDLEPSEFGCREGADNGASVANLGVVSLLKVLSLLATVWCYSCYYIESSCAVFSDFRTS